MDSISSFGGLNSQVPSSWSSLSFPSELPDVGNWFCSYEYRSPNPDSNFSVEDSASTKKESQGAGVEEVEEKVKIRGLRADGDKVVQEEDNKKQDQCMNKNLGPFSSCSLLSEPPDIGNWFSSYVYESPESATCSLLRDEVSEEKKFDFEVVKADGSRSANKGCVEHNNTKVKAKAALIQGTNKGCLEHNNTKGDHNAEVKENSTTVDTYPTKILQPCMQDKTQQHNLGPTKHKETLDLNHRSSRYDREGHLMPLDSDRSAMKPPKLLHKNDIQISETKTDIQHDYKLDLSASASKTFSTRSEACASNKENDGFVTTRKKICKGTNDENSWKKPEKILSERSTSTVTIPLQCVVAKRKALTETTNVEQYSGMGITGKWQCPQKRKPDVGPAMKQLRLERWVRRI